MRVFRGSRVAGKLSRVAGKLSRVAGKLSRVAGKKSRVRKIVAGPENCRGSKNSTLIVKIEPFFYFDLITSN